MTGIIGKRLSTLKKLIFSLWVNLFRTSTDSGSCATWTKSWNPARVSGAAKGSLQACTWSLLLAQRSSGPCSEGWQSFLDYLFYILCEEAYQEGRKEGANRSLFDARMARRHESQKMIYQSLICCLIRMHPVLMWTNLS